MTAADIFANASASLNVDLNRIIENYETLAGQSKNANCAAVVKANAYGLGMDNVAPALYHNTNCTTFFVANIIEAIELRTLLKDAVIYVFNGLFEDHIDLFVEHDIRPILNDLAQVALWQEQLEPCAIHFDTGINRLGFSEHETEQFLNTRNDLNVSLILSHLSSSDEPENPANKHQLQKLQKISNTLPNIPASLCNSAGIFLGEEYHFDMLRPGIMLYGGNPRTLPLPGGIKNTFEIKGKILQIRELKTGMSVGYNGIWTAQKPSRIAHINVGYADGYLKLNEINGKVFLNGEIVSVIGKVSMDMIAIDITDRIFDKISLKDEIELIGSNITLEMASEVSTLGHYQLLTGIGHRLHKNYKLEAKA
ncbi:MAG: alanine racemase [Kordiimonadaceae bacterium]|jgi:alanine racemase|nr:alanine racemase [Kordiimonadaceae bacterium]MBT6031597.1 alanine racemase [Kordiimonadaceae bacterium]